MDLAGWVPGQKRVPDLNKTTLPLQYEVHVRIA
jgi:hypothetical protein